MINATGLTPRQQAFVAEYLKDLNGRQAALRAGYAAAGAEVQASRLLRTRNVAAAIAKGQAERAERNHIDADRVLQEVLRVALADPRRLFHADGTPKPIHELDDDTAAAVAAVEVDRYGGLKYRLWDKNASLEKLAKHLGLYRKHQEQQGDPIRALLAELSGRSLGPSTGE